MRIAAALLATVLHAGALAQVAGATPAVPKLPLTGRLVPAKGTGVVTAKGSIRGDAIRDFLIHVGAGQTLSVELKVSNPSAYFNLMPPGSSDVAMFIGSTSGSRFRGAVPIAGDYRVRVYLMRSAARRKQASTFTLSARVSGAALTPLPPAEDALIPGTPFHARATVSCALPYQPEVRECEASVIRYRHDGTATVELRGPKGFVRRILFVKGAPVASDATEAPTSTRQDDTTTVRFGDDERYQLPDALVSGG